MNRHDEAPLSLLLKLGVGERFSKACSALLSAVWSK